MGLESNTLPIDEIASLNADGGMTKLVVAPILFVILALMVIVIVRRLQSVRERKLQESSFGE